MSEKSLIGKYKTSVVMLLVFSILLVPVYAALPQINIVKPTSDWEKGSIIPFEISWNDAEGIECDLDGGAKKTFDLFSNTAINAFFGNVGLTLGPHTITCVASNIHGDEIDLDSYRVVCNGQYPAPAESCNGVDDDCDGLVDEGGVCSIEIVKPDGENYEYGTTIPFEIFDGSGGLGSITCSLDGGPFLLFTGNTTINSFFGETGLTLGLHAIDCIHSELGLDSSDYTVVDTGPPTITLVTPENTTYVTDSVDLNFSAVDISGISWTGYSLDGGDNITSGNTTFSGLSEGQHNVTVYANDTAGNMASETVHFTVDAVPDITIRTNKPTYTTGQTLYTGVSTSGPGAVDLYVVLWIPSGTRYSLIGKNNLDTANPGVLTPRLSSWPVTEVTDYVVFQHTFGGGEPTGAYTWYAVFVIPGGDPLNPSDRLSLASAGFSFTPGVLCSLCCQDPGWGGGGIGQAEYNGSFHIAAGEKALYTFLILGLQNPSPTCKNIKMPAWVGMDPYHNTTYPSAFSRCASQCSGGKGGMEYLGDLPFRVQFGGPDLVDMITEDSVNTAYVWVEGNSKCAGNYYIVRSPIETDQAEITLENILLRKWVAAKLAVRLDER
jgi:hypothetical protein